MRSKGFTIIEMMVVVAIIGIIGAIVIPMFSPEIKKQEAIKKTEQEKQRKMENYCMETYGPMWRYSAGWCYNEKSGEQHKVEF